MLLKFRHLILLSLPRKPRLMFADPDAPKLVKQKLA